MFSFEHASVVWFAKSYGLFYLLGLSAVVLIYTYWPANKKRFDEAAGSIFYDEDKPCR